MTMPPVPPGAVPPASAGGGSTPPPAYAPYGAPPIPAEFGRPVAPRPAKPPVQVWDLVLTILFLVGLLVITAFASFAGVFLIMGADACGAQNCSTDLIVAGWLVGMILPWVAFLGIAVWAIIALVRRRLAFWIPLVGTVAVVGSVILGFVITGAGASTG